MIENLDGIVKAVPMKWLVIAAFALTGALAQRDMGWPGRIMTFVCGVLAAAVFCEPLLDLLSLSESWGHAVAGVLAVTGRNWVAFAIRASRDPLELADRVAAIIRGVRK
ncbi:hypothetical protein [Breoghania sp. L-A4]|uniref:hypothetical protein n=1 Tax=Breoghania sp. L-A4 TaxID=2304600 RepID=UPI000E3591C0|nr:hypothetical protein [Breoghania sp. L-A4]AXS39288.1 hypothetical protein D1F64_03480 [Breoghania sp. L-A4]